MKKRNTLPLDVDLYSPISNLRAFLVFSLAVVVLLLIVLYGIDNEPMNWQDFWSSREYVTSILFVVTFMLLQIGIRHLLLRKKPLLDQLVISSTISSLLLSVGFIILGILILQTPT